MKTKDKKILIRGTILVFIIILMAFSMNELSRFVLRNEKFEIIKQIDYIPENSIDILVIGNSHAQEGINDRLMSDMLGASVYNFSFSQQEAVLASYFLKKNFKKQSPKVVVLEAYTLIQKTEDGYDFIPLSKDKKDYYERAKSEVSFSDVFFPLARNHNFWANEKPLSYVWGNLFPKENPLQPVFSMATMSDEAINAHLTERSKAKVKVMFYYRFSSIRKIKELCDENDAQLIVTMLPLYKTLVDRISYDETYYDKIKEFCDTNSILYYDYNKQSPTDWTYKYFKEHEYTQNSHLNSYGQILATQELAQYIKDEDLGYTITDYPRADMLINDYLSSLASAEGILLIDDCAGGINDNINPQVRSLLKDLGIALDENNNKPPKTYYVSGGSVSYDYILPEGVFYAEDGVTIYEIDSGGNFIRCAGTRWDEFDTVIFR